MAELEQLSSPLQFLKQKEAIDQDALSDLVDLYCEKDSELEPQRALLKIKEKELAEVETELQTTLDSLNDPADDGVQKTQKWLLEFGAKGKATEITDKKKILDLLGLEVFLQLVTVPIGEVKKYLTAQQFEKVSKVVNKNKRKLNYAKHPEG